MSKATLEKTLKDYEALADNPDLSAVKAAADALAKTVRDNLGQFHDEPVIFAGDVGVAITAPRKFTYEGIEYPTAQHAFQSQKLPEDEREDASKQTLKAVIALGHNAKLDVPKWDAEKDALMYKIIFAQTEENEEMHDTLVNLKDSTIEIDDLNDKYWPVKLPEIYKKVGKALFAKQGKRARA